eukprot:jgi/Chlat1/3918/Chrsp26S04025
MPMALDQQDGTMLYQGGPDSEDDDRVRRYLQRIGCVDLDPKGVRALNNPANVNSNGSLDGMKVGDENASLRLLARLHSSHQLTVPFENFRRVSMLTLLRVPCVLAVHLGEPISMQEDAVFDKVVSHRRGGFCFELNTAFAWLLWRLGYRVTYLSGGVYSTNQSGLPVDFDHMILLVRVRDRRILCDVGFGNNFEEPLDIDTEAVQVQGRAKHRVVQDKPGEVHADPSSVYKWQYHGDTGGDQPEGAACWRSGYWFSLQERQPSQYSQMLLFHMASISSSMVKRGRMASIRRHGAREDGVERVTVSERKVTTTTWGLRVTEGELAPGQRFTSAIKDYFSMDVPDLIIRDMQPSDNKALRRIWTKLLPNQARRYASPANTAFVAAGFVSYVAITAGRRPAAAAVAIVAFSAVAWFLPRVVLSERLTANVIDPMRALQLVQSRDASGTGESERRRVLVAELDGEVQGTVALQLKTNAETEELELVCTWLRVAPGARGRGLAQALMTVTERWGRWEKALRLVVVTLNPAIARFCTNAGFARESWQLSRGRKRRFSKQL